MNEPNKPKPEQITGDAHTAPDFEALSKLPPEDFQQKLDAGELDIEPENPAEQ